MVLVLVVVVAAFASPSASPCEVTGLGYEGWATADGTFVPGQSVVYTAGDSAPQTVANPFSLNQTRRL